jgi:hypothetical protein
MGYTAAEDAIECAVVREGQKGDVHHAVERLDASDAGPAVDLVAAGR